MPKLNIRVGDKRHAEWMEYCEENGIVSAEVIRDYIDSRLLDASKPLRPKLTRKAQPKRAVRLWLTESEIEDIHLRTMLNSGTRAGWIIRVIRSVLARAPVFDDAEVRALKESTDALNAVGRNLNQIARSLHKNEVPDRAMKIERVTSDIAEHTDTVQSLIDVSRSRWEISA